MIPKIEGFGANAQGGEGKPIIRVKTASEFSSALNRNNCQIVFDADVTIKGRFELTNRSYITIDANGYDVTIDNANNGDALSIGSGCHHIIVHGIRTINAGNDGINVVDGANNIAIINCSSYGNRDGNIDIADGQYITVQNCILGPGNTSSYSGAMLVTAREVSVLKNLFNDTTQNQTSERHPLAHNKYSAVGSPTLDFRNNIVWKWGRNNGTGSGVGTAIAYKATANVINNYYYSASSVRNAIDYSDGYGGGATGRVYASGNISGNAGVVPDSVSNSPQFSIPEWASPITFSACDAARLVLTNVGPSKKNSVELSLISSVTLPNCTEPTTTSTTTTTTTTKPPTTTTTTTSTTTTTTTTKPPKKIVSVIVNYSDGTSDTLK